MKVGLEVGALFVQRLFELRPADQPHLVGDLSKRQSHAAR